MFLTTYNISITSTYDLLQKVDNKFFTKNEENLRAKHFEGVLAFLNTPLVRNNDCT